MASSQTSGNIREDWSVVPEDDSSLYSLHDDTDQEPELADDSPDPALDAGAAGTALENLIATKNSRKEDQFFDHERQLLDLYLAAGAGSDVFKQHHINAILSALKSDRLNLARELTKADTTNTLLKDQIEVLFVALGRDRKSVV